MMFPKFTKYKKMHRGRLKGKSSRNITLKFGNYGIQALESKWISSKQIEAARRVINRYIKKIGSVWIKIFPDKIDMDINSVNFGIQLLCGIFMLGLSDISICIGILCILVALLNLFYVLFRHNISENTSDITTEVPEENN